MFKRNISLDNFHWGSTAIYVRNTNNTIERNDLKSCNQEFESIWMEIKNQ